MSLRFLTAGESHGKALTGILEGIPSGLNISSSDIDKDLRRRQRGYGRGGRMKIEADHAEILSGVQHGKTLDPPLLSTKSIDTNALIKSGETLVLGGIYIITDTEDEAEIPLLSKIPVLGWLFKTRSVMPDVSELLVFITPTIVSHQIPLSPP